MGENQKIRSKIQNTYLSVTLGMALRPTMLEVTSGYSMSKNDLFLQNHRLFFEFEFEAFDSQAKS